MHIGIVTDQFPSNKAPDRGTFVLDLVNQLRSAKVDVTVISHRTNFAAMALESFIRSARVDLFDAQFIAPAGVVVTFTPRFAPFVVTVHRWDILEFPYRWPMARVATSIALRSARGVIAVGRSISEDVMKFSPRSKVAIIPNAVDTRRFRPDVGFTPLKQQLGISESHRVVLSVGHLVPRKGFQFLIGAMSLVFRQIPDCSLVIVGDGPLRDSLVSIARKFHLGERFKLVGAVPASLLPVFYAMSDVFVMPSSSEGHCVSILEAMATGKPIVASDIPANAESIEENGLLVRPSDSRALARAIITILNDGTLREGFGRQSRNKAVKEFSWDVRVRRLKEFYEKNL